MAKTPKFPNPEFWKAKDNINWKAQCNYLVLPAALLRKFLQLACKLLGY